MDNIININNIGKNLIEPMLRAADLKKIFLNTTDATFTNWSKLGLISRYKINGGVYYKLSEIQKLIENSKE